MARSSSLSLKSLTVGEQIAARSFNAATLRALSAKGIRVLGPVALVEPGDSAWRLDDNGTGKVRRFLEVLALAAA